MTLQEKIESSIRDIPNFPRAGILFKDLTPLLLMPDLCDEMLSCIFNKFKTHKIDAVAGIESRGFLWGTLLAQKLKAPFIMVRKHGKLPADTYIQSYTLEYGQATIEIHKDSITPNMKVLIHDDLLASGGTATAAAQLIQQANGLVIGFSFIVELLYLKGRDKLYAYSENIDALIKYS